MEDGKADYDDMFKLLLVGDSGVGKSALMTRFAEDRFPESHISTIGVDFKMRTLNVAGRRVRVQLWDTAGQERFRTITSTYYRGTHGVLVVYDVTSGESFSSVKRWLHEVTENCEQRVRTVLVGNKNDQPDRKVVRQEDAARFAELVGVALFETSARDNLNVEAAFRHLLVEVLQEKTKASRATKERDTVRLHHRSWRSRKRFC